MLIAALLTTAQTWKQPGCPSTGEWIQKLPYIYAVEYYSAIERSAFESVLMRWVNLEPVIRSEVRQKEKNKYHILMHRYGTQKDGTDAATCRAALEAQTEARRGGVRRREQQGRQGQPE